MTRRTAREIAVGLGFSLVMNEEFAEDVLEGFFEPEHYKSLADENPLFEAYPDERQLEYIKTLVKLIFNHRLELDSHIAAHSKGWKVERISKTAAAIMRCAICEILYLDDVPTAAAINEAVELAKGYENEDVVSFINGILGSFAHCLEGEILQPPEAAEEPPQAEKEQTENLAKPQMDEK